MNFALYLTLHHFDKIDTSRPQRVFPILLFLQRESDLLVLAMFSFCELVKGSWDVKEENGKIYINKAKT